MSTGTLYVVATPIGNLEDMTFRAVRVLKEVDLIAAEDTRHTLKLLNHFSISKPLTSYFDHNKSLKGDKIISLLEDGKNVALVTDAGTPCISDPGYQLVRDAANKGIKIIAIPGACAAVSALSASGLPTDEFLFVGFLPQKKGKRVEKLKSLAFEKRTLVFYESPKRAAASLVDMACVFGERKGVVARELTKIYEEFVRKNLSELAEHFSEAPPKGELVIMVEGGDDISVDFPDESVEKYLLELFSVGFSLKDAVKKVTEVSEMKKSEIYRLALDVYP